MPPPCARLLCPERRARDAGAGPERFRYTKGLHGLGNGLYAWLAPDGSWGWSNAGLVVDGDASLLVDTLFDLPLTREMLAAMREAEPRAAAQDRRARQHPCQRRPLLRQRAGPGAEIVASRASAEEMGETPPEVLAGLVEGVPGPGHRPRPLRAGTPSARSSSRASGSCRRREPSSGQLELEVGDEARRAARGRAGAHQRRRRSCTSRATASIFSGDILFVEGTPIVWAGPVSNWIAPATASSRSIQSSSFRGTGRSPTGAARSAVKAYLEHLRAREVRLRFDAGLDAWSAARDIELGAFAELERRRAHRRQRRDDLPRARCAGLGEHRRPLRPHGRAPRRAELLKFQARPLPKACGARWRRRRR